jgi:hypothetical protein
MAHPCCPKCSHSHFARTKNTSVGAWIVYCTHCGCALRAMPIGFKASKPSKPSAATTMLPYTRLKMAGESVEHSVQGWEQRFEST